VLVARHQADEVVADREERRADQRERRSERSEVVRPDTLACQRRAACDDENRAGEERDMEGLSE